ncbi:uncharacterized protein EV154DRAFT_490978 [Mucor mucedo]|uniref:uncharacterized protein n=1 Tax=Mucor mucedo TaxID=29922 RepID=UPI00221E4551|nr:uncharacterized protein EV154DRAFT_490978 [Mucor mucedo]KAI7896843.1 hypothetical protein EV154DRAFT_490978 [Mucor mucedo]
MARAFELLVREVQEQLHAVFLKKSDQNPGRHVMAEAANIPWSWVAVTTTKILSEHPTGLTKVILVSMLELAWEKAYMKRLKGFDKNFSSIQAVYDSSLSETFLLEVVVKRWENIQNSDIYILFFIKWIKYMNHEFLMTRKIRMLCPPKTNAPIINRYNDQKLDRIHRIALIPPTENLVFMLDRFDKAFVQREFKHKVRDITPRQTDIHLWLKIIHVEIISHITTSANLDAEEKAKMSRTDIYLMDMSSDNQTVILCLYNDQTSLTPIFKRNDYIGIVIFLMPEKEAQEAQLAKINLTSMIEDDGFSCSDFSKKDILERDEEGFMNCENYTSRIYVKDLDYCMLNVTLLGKVVGLANSNPFIDPSNADRRMNRYALRIADSTGTMDVTLWEDSGRDSRRLKIGMYILLENLVTSDRHDTNGTRVWYVNGSIILGTNLYNISLLNSLLTSNSLRSIVPLWHAKETKEDHFQIECTIIGWELYIESSMDQFVLSSNQTTSSSNQVDFMELSIGDRITALSHIGCLNPHKNRNQIECEFCGCQIDNDVVHVFRPKPGVAETTSERGWEGWVEWILDDGTSTCKAFGGEETLLNVTAYHFKLMSHRSQINLLDSVVGLPILCSLTGTSTSTYRLDQMTLLEPTQQECRDMLEIMDKK